MRMMLEVVFASAGVKVNRCPAEYGVSLMLWPERYPIEPPQMIEQQPSGSAIVGNPTNAVDKPDYSD